MHAILFDFDGVLGDTMEDNFLAWQGAMRDEGIEIQREAFFPLEGMKLKEVARKLCAGAGRTCDDPEAIIMRKEKYYLDHSSFSLYPGAEQLLDDLNARHVPLALVTAARRERLDGSLPKNFLDHFKAVVTGDKSGRGKPFPDPYLEAAKELGVPANECVVIENAPLGIQAAKAAGMRCIAISSTLGKDKLRQADEVVEKLSDVSDALQELSSRNFESSVLNSIQDSRNIRNPG